MKPEKISIRHYAVLVLIKYASKYHNLQQYIEGIVLLNHNEIYFDRRKSMFQDNLNKART